MWLGQAMLSEISKILGKSKGFFSAVVIVPRISYYVKATYVFFTYRLLNRIGYLMSVFSFLKFDSRR